MVKARYNGPSDDLYFVDGRIYEVTCMFTNIPCYGIIDEVGDNSLVLKEGFTIVEGSEEDLDWYEADQKTFKDVLVHKGKH